MKASGVCPSLVLIFLTASGLLTLFGCGSGSGPSSSATQPPATKQFLIAADSFNHRVLLFEAPFSTEQSASVVLGQAGFTTSVKATTATGLYFPEKAIADAEGNIWVSDTFNNRVLQYKKPFTNGMAASLVLGQLDFTTANFSSPTQDGLVDPLGMAFDNNGNLWVADGHNRVVEFMPPFSNGMAASLVLGQTNFVTGGNVASASGLNFPTELGFDASGNLWLVDQGNNRVLEYRPPFVSGQSASVVLGQPDFTSSAPATSATGLSQPYGIAADSSGNVWVSDYFNFRVLMFKPSFTNGMAASLVLGQPNFTTRGVSGDGQIDVPNPYGLAFDRIGNLFVAEVGWSRVAVFEPPFSTLMKATTVIGQPNFNSQGETTTASGLAGVESVSTF